MSQQPQPNILTDNTIFEVNDNINGRSDKISYKNIREKIEAKFASFTTFYVDKSRTDVYTEDGSLSNPFKTIQAAIDYVASLNLSTYVAVIIRDGIYAENIVISSENLRYLCFFAEGYVSIDPASGNALTADSDDNINLKALWCKDIVFPKPVVVKGRSGENTLNDVLFGRDIVTGKQIGRAHV